MKLPDYPIENLLDTMDADAKSRFPGLYYDGTGRLWYVDGFAASFVPVEHASNDQPGWIPGEVVRYARAIFCPDLTLTHDKILCGDASFEYGKPEQKGFKPDAKSLDLFAKGKEGADLVVTFDIKRLLPLLNYLYATGEGASRAWVTCRFWSMSHTPGFKVHPPICFETVSTGATTILMPMATPKDDELRGAPIIDDEDEDDDDWGDEELADGAYPY